MRRRQTAGAVRHRSAEPRHDWQKAPPGMTPDPPDREFRSIQVEHAGSAECILRRSMRGGCSAVLRPAPAPSWSNGNSRSWFPAGSRGGSGCGGRREYVHVASVAPSMRLTPPRPDPPRLRQIPAICRSTPCVDESLSDNEIDWGQIRFPLEKGSDPMTPRNSRTHPTVTGKLSKVGRCGQAGPLAPWMAPSSPHGCGRFACEALLRKRPNAQPPAAGPDPGGGFTACPASPHRPAKPAETQSRFGFGFGFGCCRPAAGTTAGAGRSPAAPPSPAHENDFTDFSKSSCLRHASTILRSSMRPRATHAKKRPPIA